MLKEGKDIIVYALLYVGKNKKYKWYDILRRADGEYGTICFSIQNVGDAGKEGGILYNLASRTHM